MGHKDTRNLTLADIIKGVTATDVGGNLTIRVSVAESNKSPTNILLSNESVNDGDSPGTVVGILTAVDENINDIHVFNITQDDDDKFLIVDNENALLTLKSSVSFATASSHDVTINVTDSTNLTFEKTFTIEVVPVFANNFSIQTDGVVGYLNGGDVLNMPRLSPKSFVFWYKPLTTGVDRGLINKIEATPNFKGYQWQHNSDGKLAFFLLNSTSNFAQVTSSTAITTTATWYHLVLTYSGDSGAASDFTMYIDAVAESLTLTTDTLTLSTTNTRDFNIARRSDNARYVNSRMDEVGVYNIELSLSQVQEIHNAGVPIDITALSTAVNLEAHWRFTQNDIDNFPTIADVSGNGLDLTAANMVSGNIQGDVP